MAATLQELTGGRYILGLGAGWLEEEYRAYGYDYPTRRHSRRAARGGDRDHPCDVDDITGHVSRTHYRIDGAFCLQPDPPPPILVGTNGPRRLGVVARLADAWAWDGPWETVYRPPYEILRQHCDEIGRPFDDIDRTCSLTVRLPDDPRMFEPTYTHSSIPTRCSTSSDRHPPTWSRRSSSSSTWASVTSKSTSAILRRYAVSSTRWSRRAGWIA